MNELKRLKTVIEYRPAWVGVTVKNPTGWGEKPYHVGQGQQIARKRLSAKLASNGKIPRSQPRFQATYSKTAAGNLVRTNLKPHEARRVARG